MHRRHTFLTAVLLVAVATLCVAEPRETYNEQQEAALQNVFEQILGIHPPQHLSSGTKSSSSSGADSGSVSDDSRRRSGTRKVGGRFKVPKHMIELYEQFMTTKRKIDETVRSIEPMEDPQILGSPINDMLLFNVSSFNDNEEVMNAQLHLRRRRSTRHAHFDRPKGQFLAPPSRVRIYKVIETQGRIKMIALASIPVPQTSRGGWHSLDISSPTRELLINSPKVYANLTLAIRFEAPRGRTIGPYDFLDTRDNKTSPIYLVVFSEESHENLLSDNKSHKKIRLQPEHIDILKDLIKVTRPANQSTNNYKQRHQTHHVKKKESRRHKNKNWKENMLTIEQESEGDINELISMENAFDHRKIHRSRKYKTSNTPYRENQINQLSNEIVEDINADQAIRSLEMNRRQQRSIEDNELPESVVRKHKNRSEKKNRDESTEKVVDTYIPYPDGMNNKLKHRRNAWKPKDKKQAVKNIKDNFVDVRHNTSNKSRSKRNCHLNNVYVSFDKIGWDEWIVAPIGFNLNFCSGHCDSITNTISNHAIVQRLVHHIFKNVPQTCCVPHNLEPLSFLFLDESKKGVVLKQYKDMIAKDCGCA